MNVSDFISNYRNHPVLFVGTGISLRYLSNSYTWDALLEKISEELTGNKEEYLDIKAECEQDGKYDFSKVASLLETIFNDKLKKDRNGKFKSINDMFYEKMAHGVNISRLKIYIAELLKTINLEPSQEEEIAEFKKIRKNIASVITTNYDPLIEHIFGFQPLIGNDILLSNPYGSVYKIHGCASDPTKIIITQDDYKHFDEKYELIRAQLLSIFIHNPIIFMGYNIGDENIKSILKTIFTYVEPNSDQAEKIRGNFLLVEYEAGNDSTEISEHDIDMEGFSTVRINKIKTDNFKSIFEAISNLTLPVSAMDIRKVQNIVKEIYSGGEIKVNITEDLDSMENRDKIIAIGSAKTISYVYQTASEMMSNYFNIVDESNIQILSLINKYKIQSAQYFPVFAFQKMYGDIVEIVRLSKQQSDKINEYVQNITQSCRGVPHQHISEIINDEGIATTSKDCAILWKFMNDDLKIEEVEAYLRQYKNKNNTDYRRLLCAYDMKKYQ